MLLGGELLQELLVGRVLGPLFAGKRVLQVVLLRQELPDLTPVVSRHTFRRRGGKKTDFMYRIQLSDKTSGVSFY